MNQQSILESKSSNLIYDNYKEWSSELDFIDDELSIFEELINLHFIELCNFKMYNKSKEIVQQIKLKKIDLNDLKSEYYTQQKYLSLLVENGSTNIEEEFYTKHNEINDKKMSFIESIKKLKTETYNLIKDILVRNKQKKIDK